jgi:hypothetical protein
MTKHSENTEPSNSTKPVLAVVIDKTIGGFEIKDFKVLEKPIDRHILEPHIYEGTILKSHKDTDGNDVDQYCTWDRFGKCSNWKRSDCFIDVSGL